MKRQQKGMVWMELLVAISASLFISFVGLNTLGSYLERMMSQEASGIEDAEIQGLRERLQRVFDQRLDDPFTSVAAVVFRGHPTGGLFGLEGLQVRFMDVSGNVVTWELRKEDENWLERIIPEDGEDLVPSQRTLSYTGEILISPVDISTGADSEMQHWTFPGYSSQLAQEGFAIFRFW